MDPQNEQASLLIPQENTTINSANSSEISTSLSFTDRVRQYFEDQLCKKAIYVIIWLLFTGYLTGVTNAVADNRAISLYDHTNQGLGDIGISFVHLFFNSDDINAKSNAICVYLQICLFMVYVLILRATKAKSTRECIAILIEFAVFINVLFTLRYLNVCLTSFPSPSDQVLWQECSKWDNIFVAPFLILSGSKSACHDFCFSGHTIVTTTCALMITKYSSFMNDNEQWWIITNTYWKIIRVCMVVIVWFIVFLVVLFLLILELHYTIDITVAIMLTSVIWHLSQSQIKYKYGFFGWWNIDWNKLNKNEDDYNRME